MSQFDCSFPILWSTQLGWSQRPLPTDVYDHILFYRSSPAIPAKLPLCYFPPCRSPRPWKNSFFRLEVERAYNYRAEPELLQMMHRACFKPSLNMFNQFFSIYFDQASPRAQKKARQACKKPGLKLGRAWALFYASLAIRPRPSSPSPGSFHLYFRHLFAPSWPT